MRTTAEELPCLRVMTFDLCPSSLRKTQQQPCLW